MSQGSHHPLSILLQKFSSADWPDKSSPYTQNKNSPTPGWIEMVLVEIDGRRRRYCMLLFNSKIYPHFNGKVVGLPSDWTAVMQARDARLPTIFAIKHLINLRILVPLATIKWTRVHNCLTKKRQRENRIYYLLSSV